MWGAMSGQTLPQVPTRLRGQRALREDHSLKAGMVREGCPEAEAHAPDLSAGWLPGRVGSGEGTLAGARSEVGGQAGVPGRASF